jgi:hypothetical protein
LIRELAGFTTPLPRLVRGPLSAAFSLARPRSGDHPLTVETNGDASSGVVVRLFLARGFIVVARALAIASPGTTAARNGEPRVVALVEPSALARAHSPQCGHFVSIVSQTLVAVARGRLSLAPIQSSLPVSALDSSPRLRWASPGLALQREGCDIVCG